MQATWRPSLNPGYTNDGWRHSFLTRSGSGSSKSGCWRSIGRASALLGLLLLAAPAEAQAPPPPVVSPTKVEFESLDHNTLAGTENVITHYVVELWSPGSDTVLGSPALSSPDLPKSVASQVAGSANKYAIRIQDWGVTVPPGPTFVMTIRAKGSGGTARSAVSNPFNFPITVPAPRAPTAVTVLP